MNPTPAFEVPASSSIVQVRVIDTTTDIYGPLTTLVDSPVKGHENFRCPAFLFLIEHPSGRKVLYDLGLRKDWGALSPVVVEHLKKGGWKMSAQKGVHEVLEEHGVSRNDIEALIWSHWHYDHTGDPSVFPSSTALVVGPGFKDTFLPGYPENEISPILETDYAGRELRELQFPANGTRIGDFSAIDYFGDGSFYVLDGPGHTIGHICALARVTSSPPSFVFMGGDCCHHPAEIRPSSYLPLPEEIVPHPLDSSNSGPCPGAIFDHLLKDGNRSKPFYGQLRPGLILSDPDVAEQTIEKVQAADGSGHVMVIIAHDSHLPGVIDFFLQYANGFLAKGWLERTRWIFLKDFDGALLESSIGIKL